MEMYPKRQEIRETVEKNLNYARIDEMMKDPIDELICDIRKDLASQGICIIDHEGYEMMYAAIEAALVRIKVERKHNIGMSKKLLGNEREIISSMVVKVTKSFLSK